MVPPATLLAKVHTMLAIAAATYPAATLALFCVALLALAATVAWVLAPGRSRSTYRPGYASTRGRARAARNAARLRRVRASRS